MDVSLRVEEVREYAVHKSVGLLLEPSLVSVRYARDSEWRRMKRDVAFCMLFCFSTTIIVNDGWVTFKADTGSRGHM